MFTIPSTRYALGAAAFTLLLSCAPSGTPQGATQVKMYDNAYNAPVVRIPAGAGVIFTNVGRNAHNIVPVDTARWPVKGAAPTIDAGGAQTVQLAEPGVYEFYCSFHGTKDGRGMAGAVVVGDVPYAGGPKGKVAAVAEPTGMVRRVPQTHATIQGAVDAAAPGDLILVDPGVYREEVTVTTPSLVIRGTDRNAVIVDGEFIRPNGFNVLADGVAIENLTARNATLNGFFWTGVTGYRGRYLTAYNNGDYGVYAFDSKDGLFEDSYASGSPDAGFYIGQCFPCNALVRRVTAEHNSLGYSGTNAGGELHVLSSTWRYNRGGVVPNSLDTELYPPQRQTTIRGNLIHDNNSRTASGKGLGPLAWGNGVVVGGGLENVIEGNVIANHAGHGVVIAPLYDQNFWVSHDNVVRGNRIARSGRADIAVGGPSSARNCVNAAGDASNDGATRLAPAYLACSEGRGRAENDLTPSLLLAARMWRLRDPTYPDWRTQPVPPPQTSMPDALTARAVPAVGVFERVRGELGDAPLPDGAEDVLRAARENVEPVGPAPWLAELQRWLPLPAWPLVGIVVLLALVRVGLAAVRPSGTRAAGLHRVWRLAVALTAAWVGLALVTASVFSAM